MVEWGMAVSASSCPVVRLKPGREVPVLAGHPWVFSKGVLAGGKLPAGTVVRVSGQDGRFLGLGTFHPGNTIRVRMLSRTEEDINSAFFLRRFAALKASKTVHLPPGTDGYRLVHGDADGLPGLIVDVFGETAVFQIHTAGMEQFRGEIAGALAETVGAKAVVERSDVEARRQDRLEPAEPAVRAGSVDGPVRFRENGMMMFADVLGGQKTGFFLDQRDARAEAKRLSAGRRVLNLFSYSGGFGLAAALGGAAAVVNVDASEKALDLGRTMFRENGFPEDDRYSFVKSDVFDYFVERDERLREEFGRGLVVCDPPAFAKSAGHIEQAKKAYLKLNRLCLESLEPGAVLCTCSCSGMLGLEEFSETLRIAAGQAGRAVRVLKVLGQPFDHTQLLSFPEGRYLKVLFLEVLEVLR